MGDCKDYRVPGKEQYIEEELEGYLMSDKMMYYREDMGDTPFSAEAIARAWAAEDWEKEYGSKPRTCVPPYESWFKQLKTCVLEQPIGEALNYLKKLEAQCGRYPLCEWNDQYLEIATHMAVGMACCTNHAFIRADKMKERAIPHERIKYLTNGEFEVID